MKTLILGATLALTGCVTLAPTGARVEIRHDSHPLVGFPVTHDDGRTEDGLTQLSAELDWEWESGWFIAGGLGYNLQGHGGGGFYGPVLLSSATVGKRFTFRSPRP